MCNDFFLMRVIAIEIEWLNLMLIVVDAADDIRYRVLHILVELCLPFDLELIRFRIE